ncbi:hypothetical protein C8J56DRAFT_1033566 [Mycena floridula]|nr:hypothetical protein C8J56DRAFT_1033566 [Mycena floridula]
MDHFLLNWGKLLTDTQHHYSTFLIAQRVTTAKGTNEQTQQPIVTGSSVLALEYKDVAAYTLASYGTIARLKDLERLYRILVLIAASGDVSTFQYIKRVSQELMHEQIDAEDGEGLWAREIHEWWSQVLHNGPSALIWPWIPTRLLAYTDLLGTTYSASTLGSECLCSELGSELLVGCLLASISTLYLWLSSRITQLVCFKLKHPPFVHRQ